MTHFDPGDQKTPRGPGAAPNASPRVARASFALAIVALAVGTVGLMGEHWRPGLILVLAGVAGMMTSAPPMFRAWQMRRGMRPRRTDEDPAA